MAGRFFTVHFLAVLLGVLGLSTISFSAESKDKTPLDNSVEAGPPVSYSQEESKIPQKPTTPPSLPQRAAINVPHCERYFLFKGKKMDCDSEIGKDALRLSTLMVGLPYAQSELDIYRENRQKIRLAGFVGTVGVVGMVGGLLVSHPILDEKSGAIRTGGFVTLTGIVILANSLIYGLSMMKANEVHIANAVQEYNSIHPEQPIELEFSTHIDF